MAGEQGLPRTARLLIAILALGGAAVAAAQLPAIGGWTSNDLLALAGLSAAVFALEFFAVPYPHGGETEMFGLTDAVWIAALLLVEPSVMILGVAIGALASQAAQRVQPVKIAFNVGQYVVALGLAQLVFGAFGPHQPAAPASWLAALAGMAVYFALNSGSVAWIIGLVSGRPFTDVLRTTLGLTTVQWAGNMAIGLLAALVLVTEPAGIVLVLAPLGLSYLAYRGWIGTMGQRDQMRHIALAADAISAQGDLTRRLPENGHAYEVAELATTLNAMLGRLERAYQRERQFLGETAHELRTPIGVCRGYLETLPPNASAAEVSETAGVVIRELERMGRLVSDMMILAHREQPRFVVPEAIALGPFLASVAQTAAPLLGDRLNVATVPDEAVCRVDEQRVTQALVNLLNNAALHAAGGAVTLSARRQPAAWRLEVRDEGGGLPPGRTDDLFEPFRRGGSHAPGTGLGLAIVRAIAEAHGGSAGVDNRPGIGATFWIELPDRPRAKTPQVAV